MYEMPAGLTYWAAHQVAECVDYKSVGLYERLWKIQEGSDNPPPSGGDGSDGTVETPDSQLDLSNDDKPQHWWGLLAYEEQEDIATAFLKDYG